MRGSVRRKHSAILPRLLWDCGGTDLSFLRASVAAIIEEPPPEEELGFGVPVGLAGLGVVVTCWDSSSMTQALDGGSMVGRPMRA